jgi:hypothetical protein
MELEGSSDPIALSRCSAGDTTCRPSGHERNGCGVNLLVLQEEQVRSPRFKFFVTGNGRRNNAYQDPRADPRLTLDLQSTVEWKLTARTSRAFIGTVSFGPSGLPPLPSKVGRTFGGEASSG